MTAPLVVVAGLGRCGTSLAMQMLAAMGMPCVGDWPAYEPPISEEPINARDLVALEGHALKRLNPHKVGLPGPRTRTIWLDRDLGEQARSMRKFARELYGVDHQPNRLARKRWETSLRRDRAMAMQEIGRRPLLLLSFENLLSAPETAAALMADFAGIAPADVDGAVKCVMKRVAGAECEPSLWIETALSARANTASVANDA